MGYLEYSGCALGGRVQLAALALFAASVTLACDEVSVPASPNDAGIDRPQDDAGIGDVDAAVPGCPLGAVCSGTYNFAFVTSESFTPGALGGVSGGDAHCNRLAGKANLPGRYVAWLSDEKTDAADRIAGSSGWLRTDRRPFALSRARLLAGRIVYPLSLDENGQEVSATVVTGTSMEGLRIPGKTCNNSEGSPHFQASHGG